MPKFKRTEIVQFPKRAVDLTEGNSWARFSHPTTIQEYGAINHVDIAKDLPHLVAITSYAKVQIYNAEINEVHKTISKFQDAAFGARFRRDGQLLAVGTSEGQVKVFDVATKTQLRTLHGHMTATHKVDFTLDGTHVATFSDDKTVGLWDLAAEVRVESYGEHGDYVRAGCVSSGNADLLASGSYDHHVRLWDRRGGGGGGSCVLKVDHGAPVEDLLLLPGDGILVSVGGHHLKLWDVVAGGRLLASLTPHHKTVTCLGLADGGASLVTGSLDRHVKLIDVKSFQTVGSLAYPSSVLSAAVCQPADGGVGFVVAGMIDGLVQIHRQCENEKPNTDEAAALRRRHKESSSHRYLRHTQFTPAVGDVVVGEERRDVELRHDTLLRKYEYSRALDLTLKPFVQRRKPEYAYSLLFELMRREGLRTALGGRDEKSLTFVLTYVNRYIADMRFTRLLVHVADLLVDLYLPHHGMSERIDKMFADLGRRLEREVRYVEELARLQGAVDLVLAASGRSSGGGEGCCGRVEDELFRG